MVQTIIFVSWTLIDPLRAIYEEPLTENYAYWKCSSREGSTSATFMALTIAYNLILLLFLAYLAYKVCMIYILPRKK
jgi:hypothetical protein